MNSALTPVLAGGGEEGGVWARADKEGAAVFLFTAAFAGFFAVAAIVCAWAPPRSAVAAQPCQAGLARRNWPTAGLALSP